MEVLPHRTPCWASWQLCRWWTWRDFRTYCTQRFGRPWWSHFTGNSDHSSWFLCQLAVLAKTARAR